MSEKTCKYFLSYSGIKLPLNLVSPLHEEDIDNRNTFYRAYYDDDGRMTTCQKVVYGEVELEHRYSYRDDGVISQVDIFEADADEPHVIMFDETGKPLR